MYAALKRLVYATQRARRTRGGLVAHWHLLLEQLVLELPVFERRLLLVHRTRVVLRAAKNKKNRALMINRAAWCSVAMSLTAQALLRLLLRLEA